MRNALVHRVFAPIKRLLPSGLVRILRSAGTAIFGPFYAAYQSGYWRSTFANSAVTKDGKPLPWYTYPSIAFLSKRNYAGLRVLEFGGGQSTLWWAQRAGRVVTIEEDCAWFESLQTKIPQNVLLRHIPMTTPEETVKKVRAALETCGIEAFDVIIIDGLYRHEMIRVSMDYIAPSGVVICDNAEGYGFHQGFSDSGLMRVDFFGYPPGVAFPHTTSIYFSASSKFMFDSTIPIENFF